MRSIVFSCFVLAAALGLSTSPLQAATLTVAADGMGDYTTIQAALDAAAAGDTVIVMPGLYQEDVTILKDRITVSGIDPQSQAIVRSTVVNGEITSERAGTTVQGLSVVGMACGLSALHDGDIEGVQVSGDWIVWTERNIFAESNVYALKLPGRQAVRLTQSGLAGVPAISGDIVIWREQRSGVRGIYGRRLSTNEELVICADCGGDSLPAVSGSLVVWEDAAGQVIARDVSGGQQFLVGAGWVPDVSGDIVTWLGQDPNATYRIRCRNVKTLQEWTFGEAGTPVEPKVSGDTVVWMEGSVINGRSLSTGEEFVVATITGNDPGQLDFAGDVVVWHEVDFLPPLGVMADAVMMKDIRTGSVAGAPREDYIQPRSMPATDGRRVCCILNSYRRGSDGSPYYAPSILVRDVYITGQTMGRDGASGIYMQGSNPVVCDNYVAGSIAGIGLRWTTGMCYGNTIEQCWMGLLDVHGQICGNTIRNCWLGGMDSVSGYIRGNVVADCGGQGVAWCAGSIVGNAIVGNDANGLSHVTGEAKNNIIAFNGGYGVIDAGSQHSYNCLWKNDKGPLGPEDTAGIGEFVADPLFADMAGGDYHLMSRAGRWDPVLQGWVMDSKTSRCIDAGDPADYVGDEPAPNGGRADVGAYGGTNQASLSDGSNIRCFLPAQTDLNCDCRTDLKDMGLVFADWLTDTSRQVPQSLGRTLVVAADGSGQYRSIQDAISESRDLDTVIVMPGIYPEDIWSNGRAITVRGSEPNDPQTVRQTIINGTVYFVNFEQTSSVLSGLTVAGQIGVKTRSDIVYPMALYRNKLVGMGPSGCAQTYYLASGEVQTCNYDNEGQYLVAGCVWSAYSVGNTVCVGAKDVMEPYYWAHANALASWDISGESVVWADSAFDSSGMTRIYRQEMGYTEPVTVATVRVCNSLRASGDFVVWQDENGLMCQNSRSGRTYRVFDFGDTLDFSYDISGSTAVCGVRDSSGGRIYTVDLQSGASSAIVSETGAMWPMISGRHIVWLGGQFPPQPLTIEYMDLATGKRTTLYTFGVLPDYYDVSGDNVVWFDDGILYWRSLVPGPDVVTARQSRGIVCVGSSPTITGNLICDSIGAGIECTSGASPFIFANEIRRCADGGISGSAGEMRGNTIMDCDANGLSRCTGPVTGNVIAFNGAAAVSGCTALVMGNTIFGQQYAGYPDLLGFAGNNILGGIAEDTWDELSYTCVWESYWRNDFPFYANPLFVDAEGGDFHLRSQYGRWDSLTSQWVTDANTSPCIDAGEPAMGVGSETNPNGGRRDLGAYGGTPQASRSATSGPEPAAWCTVYSPADLNRDCIVNLADYAIFAGEWTR